MKEKLIGKLLMLQLFGAQVQNRKKLSSPSAIRF